MARGTVARLMRAMGLAGAVWGRAWVTPTHAGEGGRPGDLVDRRFVATRPNQRWVSDCTYVATWGGFVYVAFVIDVLRRPLEPGQYLSMRYTDRLVDAGIAPSVGSQGDASPSRTVAAPHAPLPAADQANASQADPPGLTVSVSVSASQHLIIEVL